jgi:hypothetical protein
MLIITTKQKKNPQALESQTHIIAETIPHDVILTPLTLPPTCHQSFPNLIISLLLPRPTRILRHQRRQRNSHIPRIYISIQAPIKENLDTALDAIVAVFAVDGLGLVFEGSSYNHHTHVSLLSAWGMKRGCSGCLSRSEPVQGEARRATAEASRAAEQ